MARTTPPSAARRRQPSPPHGEEEACAYDLAEKPGPAGARGAGTAICERGGTIAPVYRKLLKTGDLIRRWPGRPSAGAAPGELFHKVTLYWWAVQPLGRRAMGLGA